MKKKKKETRLHVLHSALPRVGPSCTNMSPRPQVSSVPFEPLNRTLSICSAPAVTRTPWCPTGGVAARITSASTLTNVRQYSRCPHTRISKAFNAARARLCSVLKPRPVYMAPGVLGVRAPPPPKMLRSDRASMGTRSRAPATKSWFQKAKCIALSYTRRYDTRKGTPYHPRSPPFLHPSRLPETM